MPRPAPPPTPTSSTEIRGKDGSQYSALQMSFELPPPAVTGSESHNSTATSRASSSHNPASSPISSPAIPASETVKIRRRLSAMASASAPAKEAFALPPPPTRSRKIIQMKPRGQQQEEEDVRHEGGTANASSKTPAGKPTPATSSKKKQPPSSTSVAGRKIARKTAHSLIERRRRSKMNEEFGVLKDMIPACTGEMHKLAILQASIDYVRYLEDCVAKLKAENSRTNTNSTTPPFEQFTLSAPTNRSSYTNSHHAYDQANTHDEDTEMTSPSASSPAYSTPILRPLSHSTPHSFEPSPALHPNSRPRQSSHSSTITTTDTRHYSFSTSSNTTSPALGPAAYEYARSASYVGSALTSPALRPVDGEAGRDGGMGRDLDQEAMAALLMLNADRRGRGSVGDGGRGEEGRGVSGSSGITSKGGAARGMSVKDLLST